jgi:hypothetical protein
MSPKRQHLGLVPRRDALTTDDVLSLRGVAVEKAARPQTWRPLKRSRSQGRGYPPAIKDLALGVEPRAGTISHALQDRATPKDIADCLEAIANRLTLSGVGPNCNYARFSTGGRHGRVISQWSACLSAAIKWERDRLLKAGWGTHLCQRLWPTNV